LGVGAAGVGTIAGPRRGAGAAGVAPGRARRAGRLAWLW